MEKIWVWLVECGWLPDFWKVSFWMKFHQFLKFRFIISKSEVLKNKIEGICLFGLVSDDSTIYRLKELIF